MVIIMNDTKNVNYIKTLAIDMINNAKSGHPGVALGAANIIYTLYSRHININYKDPNWFCRDRFVLSNGHASSLLYSILFYSGFLTIDDLKKFRRLNSNTPGHPEISTPGVDISTGPLGQGISSAVGMAISQKYYQSKINNKISFKVYVMCGDGDLMEGISYESMSIAGTLKLNNLIVLYDSNNISLDGNTNLTFNENMKLRMESINWNYIKVNDDIDEIDSAIITAKNSEKPTLIEIKTILGKESMLQNTNLVHGKPLTSEDIFNLKNKFNLDQIEFQYDENLINEFRNIILNRINIKYNETKDIIPLNESIDVFSLINPYYENMKETMREVNGKIMNQIGKNLITFIGGAADTSTSTKTILLNEGIFNKDNYCGRNIYYGVREHAMGAISNGIASCGLIPFASTFLAFADYLKSSIRMSCMMNLHVIYIFTHDSICIGNDGPTHQPIEQLSMLREIPNLDVYRPCDANELLGTWDNVLKKNNPSAIILSRDYLPLINGSDKSLIKNGAYIIKKEIDKLDAIIIATGSEVEYAMLIADVLLHDKINIRVVSMPSINIFESMKDDYKNQILPFGIRKIVIEFGTSNVWYKYVTNKKYLININDFGKSGNKDEVLKYFSLDFESVKNYIKDILK